MDHMGFQIPGMAPPPLINQPPQIFGSYGPDGLPQMPPDLASHMFPDAHLLMEDTNEAKRRRIARVQWTSIPTFVMSVGPDVKFSLGLRHVSQEEDQMRRQAALMHALHQLQDRLCLYASRKEAQSSKGVRSNRWPLP